MFTGIIEQLGEVAGLTPQAEGARLALRVPFTDLKTGESVAVNGCCLTQLGDVLPGTFAAFLSRETLDRTGLGTLQPGEHVNLERAMAADGRFGGHIVQGHVDGVGRLQRLEKLGEGYELDVQLPPGLLADQVEKGSIALDGISLTVARMLPDGVRVALIPHTVEATNLRQRKPGDPINVEVDILGKYVRAYLSRLRP